MSTQITYPWRTTARTVFQLILGLAAAVPLVYLAVTGDSPEAATGAVGVALAVSAAVTRAMAVPAIDVLLARFAPWLAAEPAPPTV